MKRKNVNPALAALGLTLLTGGCTSTGQLTSSITPQTVVQAAIEVCGFQPLLSTATALLRANPTILLAEQWGKLICDAVGPGPVIPAVPSVSMRRRAAPQVAVPVVVGSQTIVIKGRFLD